MSHERVGIACMPMHPGQRAQLVKNIGRELGFDRVGITRAAPLTQARYYKKWLAAGYAGAMAYLHRNVELRCDPRRLLPGARSVICVALSYRRREDPAPARAEPTGRVAQYARGRDYHRVIAGMLDEMLLRLRTALHEPLEARVCVDTAPVLERQLAAAAGLGWLGKNTLLLDALAGSYFFLGEAITTLELAYDAPVADHCGTCTRCLDACPTRAFPQPGVLDATRCISYHTIESRAMIPPGLAERFGDWVYGCDVCQEVCPFNREAPLATNPLVAEDRIPARLPLPQVARLTPAAYRSLVAGTAADRATRAMWRRNAIVALANRKALRRTILEQALADASPLVSETARQYSAGVADD